VNRGTADSEITLVSLTVPVVISMWQHVCCAISKQLPFRLGRTHMGLKQI